MLENKTEEPLISIIIPAYNYGRYLSETFEGLLALDYTNWECIIISSFGSFKRI